MEKGNELFGNFSCTQTGAQTENCAQMSRSAEEDWMCKDVLIWSAEFQGHGAELGDPRQECSACVMRCGSERGVWMLGRLVPTDDVKWEELRLPAGGLKEPAVTQKLQRECVHV